MPSGLICIECRIEGENQGIFANTKVKTRMGQGRGIVGGKSSSFTYPPFEYSSIHHTNSKCGELQYCNNNVATLKASFFTFINLVVRNKLGSDGVVCTSTSSYCRLSLDQLEQVR